MGSGVDFLGLRQKVLDMGLSFKLFQRSARDQAASGKQPWVTAEEAGKVCDLDAAAQELIVTSNSPSHTTFNDRRCVKVANIISDMFAPEHFQNRTLVEFGPGHYSFALLARHLGATVVCVEYDPALVALGEYLGFEVHNTNLDVITRDFFGRTFDGLWLKGCFNACRLPDDRAVTRLTEELTGLLTPDAWGWLVPCNKGKAPVGEDQAAFEARRVSAQTQAFKELGWTANELDHATMRSYASAYRNAPHIFTRGLHVSQ